MLSSSTSWKLCTFRGKGNRVVIWKGLTTWQDNSLKFLQLAILSKGKLTPLKITFCQTQIDSVWHFNLAAKSLEFQTPCDLERMMGTVLSPKFAPHLSQKFLMTTLRLSSTALNWNSICPRLFLCLQLQTTLSLIFP